MTSAWGSAWGSSWGNAWGAQQAARVGGSDGTDRRTRKRITVDSFSEAQRQALLERVHAAKMRHFMPAPPTAPAAEPAHVAKSGRAATAIERASADVTPHQPSRLERERARVERDRLRQEQVERSAAVHKSSERIRQKRREQERQQARVNLLVLRNQQAVIALLLAA